MADKPKTYAQQVHELKDQLAQKDEQIAKLMENPALIHVLQQENAELKARLEAGIQADNHNAATDKARTNDLIQRAESAEQGLRNAQNQISALQDLQRQLETQLNLVSVEADKTIGKDKKITALEEHIKNQNFELSRIQQQYRDFVTETNEASAKQEREVIYLRALTRAQVDKLNQMVITIREMPDTISALKEMIARW